MNSVELTDNIRERKINPKIKDLNIMATERVVVGFGDYLYSTRREVT